MIGETLGHYRIIEKIGAGGMGEVYRAQDTKLPRQVALKVLLEKFSSDQKSLARFEREARTASALNHPSIVTIYEIGSHGCIPYLVMELIDGTPLRNLVTSGPMPIHEILRLSKQVADALAKAHAAGIVHRDLTPGNILVLKSGLAKIVDFGLAKLLESEGDNQEQTSSSLMTNPGTVMGTPSYMSPEQARGLPLDYRSDQFSLGAILYEMATGTRAFQRETWPETMTAVMREEPVPMMQLNPRVPPALAVTIERCLAKNPKHRFENTQRLAKDLDRLQVGYLLDQLRPVREPVSEELRLEQPAEDAWRTHLVFQLLSLLRGGSTHVGLREAIVGLPAELRGVRPEGAEHSAWQLLEHIRIAQWDFLESSRNPKHASPEFPGGYWPQTVAPPDEVAWENSVEAFRADLMAMRELVADPKSDLFERLPGRSGRTILQQALLVADHNAYHLGQLVQLRRLLGDWRLRTLLV